MDNKMSSTAKSCKENNKKICIKKEKFMKLEGYRIKVGEDTYILFKNEAFYLQMLYLEKVYFDIYKQLFNNKEVLPLIFRLNTLEIYLKYFMKYYHSIQIKVFYDRRKYENPLKIKFPNLTWRVDEDRKEEIEEEIDNFENLQLSEAFIYHDYLLGKIMNVSYTKGNQLSKNLYSKYVSSYDSDSGYYDYEYGPGYSDSDSDSDSEFTTKFKSDFKCLYESEYESESDYSFFLILILNVKFKKNPSLLLSHNKRLKNFNINI